MKAWTYLEENKDKDDVVKLLLEHGVDVKSDAGTRAIDGARVGAVGGIAHEVLARLAESCWRPTA